MAWIIDSAHSEVGFTARHMMISNVRGQFHTVNGTVDFNESDPTLSTVNVTIDAASLNSRDDKRDGHLKSPDFLDIENFPEITFVSKAVEKVSDDRGRIIGDLTIRGVTREVVLDVEYNGKATSPWGSESAGFSATTKINRRDFGLVWNVALETGGVLVGEEIKIAIELEIVKQAEPELVTA